MQIDIDKETVQAVGVISLLVILVVILTQGAGETYTEALVGALLAKLGLSEGYILVKKTI